MSRVACETSRGATATRNLALDRGFVKGSLHPSRLRVIDPRGLAAGHAATPYVAPKGVGLGAGSDVLGPGGSVPAGKYWLRLTQGPPLDAGAGRRGPLGPAKQSLGRCVVRRWFRFGRSCGGSR